MHERLRRARLLAGFDTARAAIERFGWKASTYRAHENGQNKFRASDAGAYARAYKTSSAWLLFGEQGPGSLTSVEGVGESLVETMGDGAVMREGCGAQGDRRHAQSRVDWGEEMQVPAPRDHFDLSLDTDDLSDVACRGDILRFAPVFDHRNLSDGDIVAIERRTESGVDILPKRVFIRHGEPLLAAHPASRAETLRDARILGKAIWLLRRLAL